MTLQNLNSRCSAVFSSLTLSRLVEERPEFPDQARLVLQLGMEMSNLAAQGFIGLQHAPVGTGAGTKHFMVSFWCQAQGQKIEKV